jgi:hypothetical protein
VNAGYHREELKPIAARPLAEDVAELRAALARAIGIIRDEYPPCDIELYGVPEMEAVLAKTEPRKQP